MTLKERIENNLTLYTLGLLLTGFLAGLGTFKFLLEATGQATSVGMQCTGESWKPPARQAAWIPTSECPAYPLELKLSSPGSNTVVAMQAGRDRWFDTPLVVGASRPLPEKINIGIVFKPLDSPNYYVLFPGFTEAGSRANFRRDLFVELPFALKKGMSIELRATVIDNRDKLGTVYSDLEQIRAADPSVFLSPPVQVRISE
jgi:hypothetical protein